MMWTFLMETAQSIAWYPRGVSLGFQGKVGRHSMLG
jgi:hypothetical protein